MNGRDIIYELIQGGLEDDVFIYDERTDTSYDITGITAEKGSLCLDFKSEETVIVSCTPSSLKRLNMKMEEAI